MYLAFLQSYLYTSPLDIYYTCAELDNKAHKGHKLYSIKLPPLGS